MAYNLKICVGEFTTMLKTKSENINLPHKNMTAGKKLSSSHRQNVTQYQDILRIQRDLNLIPNLICVIS